MQITLGESSSTSTNQDLVEVRPAEEQNQPLRDFTNFINDSMSTNAVPPASLSGSIPFVLEEQVASTPVAPETKRRKLSISDKAETDYLEQQQREHKSRMQNLHMEIVVLKAEHEAKMKLYAKKLNEPLSVCCKHKDNVN